MSSNDLENGLSNAAPKFMRIRWNLNLVLGFLAALWIVVPSAGAAAVSAYTNPAPGNLPVLGIPAAGPDWGIFAPPITTHEWHSTAQLAPADWAGVLLDDAWNRN